MIKVVEYSKNKVKTINFDKISLTKPKQSKLWVDVTNPSDEELKKIIHSTSILISDLKNCLDPKERPRLKETGKYRLIIFKATADENIMTLGIFFTKEYILTIHKEVIEPIDTIQRDILKLNSVNIIKKGLNYLVYHILTEVTRKYFEILDDMEEELDKLEDKISKGITHNVGERITFIKKILIYFRQALLANRDVLINLEKSPMTKDREIETIREIQTETTQLIDEESIYHDRLTGVRENYLTSISNNLNEVIKEFTVLAMVILVPTLIATLYGMNFKVIPLATHQYGFWILIAIMVLSTLLILLYFKTRKWI